MKFDTNSDSLIETAIRGIHIQAELVLDVQGQPSDVAYPVIKTAQNFVKLFRMAFDRSFPEAQRELARKYQWGSVVDYVEFGAELAKLDTATEFQNWNAMKIIAGYLLNTLPEPNPLEMDD